MAKQTINLGVAPDGAGGDSVRSGFTKVNSNFDEVYDNVTSIQERVTPIELGGTGATTAAAARQGLELGDAATRDVGISDGDVMEVSAFGLGSMESVDPSDRNSFFSSSDLQPHLPHSGAGVQSTYASNRRGQMFVTELGEMYYRFSRSDSVKDSTTPWVQVANKKYVDDAVASIDSQPVISGTVAFTGADNKIVMTNIVSGLGLEVGDVIEFGGAADETNKKLRTVESITDNNTIIVNYEHCGNRGNGSLKLSDQSGVSVTVKRIAKWYNAPIWLGQAWVDETASRSVGVTYTNTTGRAIEVLISSNNNTSTSFKIDGVSIFVQDGNSGVSIICATIPNGSTYELTSHTNSSGFKWLELR